MKQSLFVISYVLYIFFFVFYLFPLPASAETKNTSNVFFTDPLNLGNETSPQGTVQNAVVHVLSFILGFIGVMTFIIFVYAGFTWMLARGNDKQIETAKNTMFWAAIGILIVFGSYAILYNVIGQLAGTFGISG
jgi:cbb3-type cytochrome oxidase subunit 3